MTIQLSTLRLLAECLVLLLLIGSVVGNVSQCRAKTKLKTEHSLFKQRVDIKLANLEAKLKQQSIKQRIFTDASIDSVKQVGETVELLTSIEAKQPILIQRYEEDETALLEALDGIIDGTRSGLGYLDDAEVQP